MSEERPTRLLLMRTGGLEDPREHPEWEALLPEGRWQKAMQLLQAEDRKNSAGAGWLLRHVLPGSGAISLGLHGKPLCEGLHFNLSHSGELVICAVGRQEIGCDVQKRKPCRDSMVRRYFAPEEQEYIFSAEGREKEERFLTLWCRKESLLKRTGEGLTKELREVSCLSGEGFYEMWLEDYRICISCADPADAREENVLVEWVTSFR